MKKRNRKERIVIGLTGGIATGKTSVLNEFKKHGIKTISCDEISKKIYRRRTNVRKRIKKFFGTLNRKKIAEIIFSDVKKRKLLERILHPEIIKELNRLITQSPNRLIVVDAPLLFEADIPDMFGKIIVVYCPENVQIKRLAVRDRISVSDAKKRIRSQMQMREKIKMADYVVDNSGSFAATKKEIKKILDKLS